MRWGNGHGNAHRSSSRACGRRGARARAAGRGQRTGAPAPAVRGRLLRPGHPRRGDARLRRRPLGRVRHRASPQRDAVPPGDRDRRLAARQPRDGQHRRAGRVAPDPGLVGHDLGLPVPRRRAHAQDLRRRGGTRVQPPRARAAQHPHPRAALFRHAAREPPPAQAHRHTGRHGRPQAPHAARRGLAVPWRGARRQPDPRGLRRALHRAADRRGGRAGQPPADQPHHALP